MLHLLASPRLRLAGGVRVVVMTLLAKTTNSVAMVVEKCVMVVAPT